MENGLKRVPIDARCLRENFSIRSRAKTLEERALAQRAYILRDQLNFRREPDTRLRIQREQTNGEVIYGEIKKRARARA